MPDSAFAENRLEGSSFPLRFSVGAAGGSRVVDAAAATAAEPADLLVPGVTTGRV